MADGNAAATTELGRGAAIGRYLVLSLIGKGGMGEVYAAYDPELDRKVAVKVLRGSAHAGVDAAEGRGRILREAQALAQLSDPNVVAVYDVGTVGDRVFLAMEFVDGSTLSYWQNAKPRTWREVVALYAAAGSGLAAAHRRGLVHRDFKPENAMVGRDGKVRVMDFGLARSAESAGGDGASLSADERARISATMSTAAVGLSSSNRRRVSPEAAPPGDRTPHIGAPAFLSSASAGEGGEGGERSSAPGRLPRSEPALPPPDESETRNLAVPRPGPSATVVERSPAGAPGSGALNVRLTLTGAMMGTPAYMAPEQFAGKVADARSDQFSFCVALYEGIYGERPFAGKNLNDLTRNVLAGRVREAPQGSNVPSWVRKVVLRGLRVDRDDRHPSMEALLAELARDPPRARRRWAAAAALAGLIVALAGGLIDASRAQRTRCLGAETKFAGIWELPRPGAGLTARKEAIRRSFMATGKRYAAEAFTRTLNELDRYVTAWNDMHRDACEATHVRGEQSGEVLDLRMSCLQDRFNEVRALTNVFSDADGEVVAKAAQAVQSLRPLDQCADVAALKAVIRAPDDPEVRRAVADLRSQLADVKALGDAGKLRQARAQIGPLVEAARATKYGPVEAEALFRSGELKAAVGAWKDAERDEEEAVWMAESTHDDEVVAEGSAELVYLVGYAQDRYADGERWSRQAGAAIARMGAGHDLAAGWLANNRALLYGKEGLLDEALAAGNEAVRIKERAFGSTHFDVALSEDTVAEILFQMDRVDEALVRNQRSLQILAKAVGSEHPSIAYLLSNTADLLNAKGRYLEAKNAAEKALAIWTRDLNPGNATLAYALVPLGRSFIGAGLAKKAIPVLEHAIELATHKDSDHMLLGEAHFALARAFREAGEGPVERWRRLAAQASGDFGTSAAGTKRKRAVELWLEARDPGAGRVSVSMR